MPSGGGFSCQFRRKRQKVTNPRARWQILWYNTGVYALEIPSRQRSSPHPRKIEKGRDSLVFLHLSDLHLGRSLNDFDLLEDQKYILDEVIQLAEQEKADAVLLAGDLYDRPIPPEGAVRLLDRFLSALAERRIKVFLISGNHDSDDRVHFGSALFRNSGVYVEGVYRGKLEPVTLQDQYGPVNFYLLPFVKASQVRAYHPDAEIANYDDAVHIALADAGMDTSVRNVLLAHQFVTDGGKDPDLGGSESSSTRNVGTIERISSRAFDGIDYVALGHIHSAQAIGRPEVRYAGSPLKYSLSEVDHRKTATLVSMGTKGKVDIKELPLTPMRDLRHLKGRLEQLLKPEHITDPEDYIYVTLTDETPIDNAMGILQQYYPRTVSIDYERDKQAVLEGDIVLPEDTKSFEQLIADFYQLIYGTDITDAEMALIQKAAKEAGILHETD